MKALQYILPAFVLLLITACEKTDKIIDPVVPKDPVPVSDVRNVAALTSGFGWDLFREVTGNETEENVLISPLSVQVALTMAVNGAGGETRTEMLDVLGCPGCSVEDLNVQTQKLRRLMEEQSGHPRLTSANGFFYDPLRIEVFDPFVQALTTYYEAGFSTHNFGDPATVDKINAWVKDHTLGKIEEIVDEISDNDLAFLINALHFKADWATAFDPQTTHPATFTTGAGRPVQTEFMNADRNFSTAQWEQFRMVDMPFRDSTYSLSLVQPDEQLSLQPDWIIQLSADDLAGMWDGLVYDRAWVSFPRLDLEFEQELNSTLKNMGMEKAFRESEADFSKLGRALIGPVIYISKVMHKAVLKVDEKGAEGAAVTSVTFSTTSAPPSFIFNRPFVLILRHTATNAILFAALVNDPV